MFCRKLIMVMVTGAFLAPSSRPYPQSGPFISFEVEPGVGCNILLQWEVIAGADTLKFDIEKSTDKQSWEVIGHEHVRPTHRYLMMDNNPLDSINFYRVRQVSSQGRNIYSETKSILVNTARDIFIWPNPARDILHIKTPFLNGEMDIFNNGGELMRKIIIVDFVTDISTVGLAKGLYFVHIRAGNLYTLQRFIRE